MAPRLTQPLTEASTRNFTDSKARPTLKSDNLTAIREQTVQTVLDPRHLNNVNLTVNGFEFCRGPCFANT
jgi:hypothetical protein